MDFIEEFKKRFKDKKSLEGIDEDAIWTGVSDSLDQLDNSNENKKRRYLFILFFFGMIGLGSSLFIYNAMDKDELKVVRTEKQEPKTTDVVEEEILNDAIVKNTIADNNMNNHVSRTSNSLTNNPTINNKTKENKFNENAYDLNFSIAEIISKEKVVDGNNDLETGHATPKNPLINIGVKIGGKKGSEMNPSFNPNLNTTNQFKVQLPYLDYPSLLEIVNLNGNQITQLRGFKIKGNINQEKNTASKENNSTWEIQLGAFAGANLLFNFYGENIADSEFKNKLKKSHSTLLGYSGGANIFLNNMNGKKNNKFHIKTGLEYTIIHEQFDIVHESPSEMLRAGYSGQLELVPAVANRTVKNVNQYQFMTVPLEIGIMQGKNKFKYGISGGFGLNYFITQKGKSLHHSDVVLSIDNKENKLYNSVFLSYHLSPFMSYDLTEKCSIRLNQNLRYQNHGNSNFYNTRQSSLNVGLNVGVLYKL